MITGRRDWSNRLMSIIPTSGRTPQSCSEQPLDLAFLLGRRWIIPLLQELLFEPRRFSDLRASIKPISANVLTAKLRELEQLGILEIVSDRPHSTYCLTRVGRMAQGTLFSLARWQLATASTGALPALTTNKVTIMLAALLHQAPPTPKRLHIGIAMGGRLFELRAENGDVEVRPLETPPAGLPQLRVDIVPLAKALCELQQDKLLAGVDACGIIARLRKSLARGEASALAQGSGPDMGGRSKRSARKRVIAAQER